MAVEVGHKMKWLIVGLLLVYSGSSLAADSNRIMLRIRACATYHEVNGEKVDDGKRRCELFKKRDSGAVEWCQEEEFDVTHAENAGGMTLENCQMRAMIQSSMAWDPKVITICGATCVVIVGTEAKLPETQSSVAVP